MVQSRDLCLHVGYGKTGSTYLQAWLAAQASRLAEEGFYYPIPETGLGDSGNGCLLLEALANPALQPTWLSQPSQHAMLFSREQLARELSDDGACMQLAAWAQRWQLGPVRVLLMVRDPQEHCYSLWAQKVKRAGERRSLHAFAQSYDAIAMASRFIKSAVAAGLQVEVLDYGIHRRELVPRFCQWLNPAHSVDLHTVVPVLANPTPHHGQLRLQRRLHFLWPGGLAPVPSAWLCRWLEPRHGLIAFSSEQLDCWAEQVMAFNAICHQLGVISDSMPCGTGMLRNCKGIILA